MSLLLKERDKAICKLIKQGATYEEVSNIYKITRQRAFQIFRKSHPKPKV